MTPTIDQRFSYWLNNAAQYYKDDRLSECIEICKAILADSAFSRHIGMKTPVLLGNTIGDWEEAIECCNKAEVFWRIASR